MLSLYILSPIAALGLLGALVLLIHAIMNIIATIIQCKIAKRRARAAEHHAARQRIAKAKAKKEFFREIA